jgi:hypothetical protein
MTTPVDGQDCCRRSSDALRWQFNTGVTVSEDQPGVVTLERVTLRGTTARVQLMVDDRGGAVVTRQPAQAKRVWWRIWA